VVISRGVVAGPIRLVHSVDDFDAVRPGDVIVCRTTDPSWTVLLADELSECGAKAFVEDVYREFLPLNARLVQACTAWQLTILPDGSMKDNDHGDAQRDRPSAIGRPHDVRYPYLVSCSV
jgi:hypothetical protein